MQRGDVQKLVIVVTGTETNETLERWVFNVETDREVVENGCAPQAAPRAARSRVGLRRLRVLSLTADRARCVVLCSAKRSKSEKEITQEIQAIIRQITASVTFLPILEEPCACRGSRPAGARLRPAHTGPPPPLRRIRPPCLHRRRRRGPRRVGGERPALHYQLHGGPPPELHHQGERPPPAADRPAPLQRPHTSPQVHKVDAMVAYKNAEDDDV